jgi:hypothetical protein
VLVSGLIWPGPPATFLDAALRRGFHLLTSEKLLIELDKRFLWRIGQPCGRPIYNFRTEKPSQNVTNGVTTQRKARHLLRELD